MFEGLQGLRLRRNFFRRAAPKSVAPQRYIGSDPRALVLADKPLIGEPVDANTLPVPATPTMDEIERLEQQFLRAKGEYLVTRLFTMNTDKELIVMLENPENHIQAGEASRLLHKALETVFSAYISYAHDPKNRKKPRDIDPGFVPLLLERGAVVQTRIGDSSYSKSSFDQARSIANIPTTSLWPLSGAYLSLMLENVGGQLLDDTVRDMKTYNGRGDEMIFQAWRRSRQKAKQLQLQFEGPGL